MRHARAKAHLARAASAGDGDAGDGSSGQASALSHAGRRAVAAGGDGRECMATCQGRSGQLERAPATYQHTHERTAAAQQQPLRLQDAASVGTWTRDDVDARPVQHGGSQIELVSVSVSGTMHVHACHMCTRAV
jgi:hypothetical protein